MKHRFKPPKVPQQLVVLGIFFVALIAIFVIVRRIFIPPSFGLYGHYRANAVEKNMAQEIAYAGAKACYDCHSEIYELKAKSYHRDVSCEACHGPSAKHVESPSEFIPTAPRERGRCPTCHDYNPSRPTGFPQVITEQHNPGKACMSCHQPHNPTLPQPPGSCSACHREIASEKIVSRHAALECTICHTVPDEHLTNPRFNEVGKPQDKYFCGKCHAPDADSPKEIARVDIETHGGRYLCWDCHYPHYPQARQ
jgi:hypothetical protein